MLEDRATETELVLLKNRFSNGEMTEEEYRKAVDEVLEKL